MLASLGMIGAYETNKNSLEKTAGLREMTSTYAAALVTIPSSLATSTKSICAQYQLVSDEQMSYTVKYDVPCRNWSA